MSQTQFSDEELVILRDLVIYGNAGKDKETLTAQTVRKLTNLARDAHKRIMQEQG